MRHLSRFHRLVSIAAFGLAATAVFLTPAVTLAQGNDYGLSVTASEAQLPNTGKTVQQIIGNVIGTALSLISVLFFALMLYAGLKWMLARGDSDEAKKALDTIVAAIIGMIIVLGSYAITSFVFDNLGGGAGTTGAATGGAPAGGGAGGANTKDWISNDINGKYCADKYGSDGFSCNPKTACLNDTPEIKTFVKATYDSIGYGKYNAGGNYITNACPDSPAAVKDYACCIK